MTPTTLRALGQIGTGNESPFAFAHVPLLPGEGKPFNDQDDESNLASWPQPTLKQSRLMIWIYRHPYKGLTIIVFMAITFVVLFNLILGRLLAATFPREDYSYQSRKTSPELLLYCDYDLISKPLDTF